jgi:hypothetical protein
MTSLPLGQPVPVFNCVVHVARAADGAVTARVVNLAGIEKQAASEREALTAVVAEFKATVARYHTSGEPIPWLAPPPLGAGQSQRLIAVHL